MQSLSFQQCLRILQSFIVFHTVIQYYAVIQYSAVMLTLQWRHRISCISATTSSQFSILQHWKKTVNGWCTIVTVIQYHPATTSTNPVIQYYAVIQYYNVHDFQPVIQYYAVIQYSAVIHTHAASVSSQRTCQLDTPRCSQVLPGAGQSVLQSF